MFSAGACWDGERRGRKMDQTPARGGSGSSAGWRGGNVLSEAMVRRWRVNVRVKLMGLLKGKSPPGGSVELPQGATIAQALEVLDIPADSVQVLMVNGTLQLDRGYRLADNDELTILAPVGGG